MSSDAPRSRAYQLAFEVECGLYLLAILLACRLALTTLLAA